MPEALVTSADGTPLSVRTITAVADPEAVVVLLHGGAEHGGRYEGLVSSLVESGIEVRALDLRGHGRSGGAPGNIDRFEEYLEDLDAVVSPLAAEQGSPPIFLLGYSLGGLVSLTYAVDHEDRLAGIVLAGPALRVGEGESSLLFGATRALAVVTPRLGLFKMDPDSMMSDPATAQAYRDDPLVFHGRFKARMLGAFMGAMKRAPQEAGQLHLPLLVLHGGDDATAGPGGSREIVERAGSTDKQLRIYDGMRHDIFNEPGAEQVWADAANWIRAHVPVHA